MSIIEKFLPKTTQFIRFAKIVKALKKENNFECDEDTVKSIIDMIRVSNLSNEQIQNEVLEMHIFEVTA